MPAQTIPLSDFRRVVESGRLFTLLDVRTPAEFKRVHVVGATLSPIDDLNPAAFAAEHRNATDPIYVICQSGGRAARACERLTEAGVAQVFSVEGGTSAWEKSGLPVERSGSKNISLERQVRIAAGLLMLLSILLARFVHPAFISLAIFVGAGLVFAGITDYCGMGILLGKMPWNR